MIRIQNLLIIAFTQYTMRYFVLAPLLKIHAYELQMGNYQFFLLVFASICLTAAGYVINDYFDMKTDFINHPESVIVGKRISRRAAMFWHLLLNGIAVLCGLYVSWYIGYPLIAAIFIAGIGLLWFYSTTYKKQFLIGNIIIAIFAAVAPFLVVFFEIPLLHEEYYTMLLKYQTTLNYVIFYFLGFSVFAFLLTLAREIVKDAEDFEGDSMSGINSVPVVLGMRSTKIIINTIIAITIIGILLAQYFIISSVLSWIYIVSILILPLMATFLIIGMAKSKKYYSRASLLLKITMLAGICYVFILKYAVYLTYNMS